MKAKAEAWQRQAEVLMKGAEGIVAKAEAFERKAEALIHCGVEEQIQCWAESVDQKPEGFIPEKDSHPEGFTPEKQKKAKIYVQRLIQLEREREWREDLLDAFKQRKQATFIEASYYTARGWTKNRRNHFFFWQEFRIHDPKKRKNGGLDPRATCSNGEQRCVREKITQKYLVTLISDKYNGEGPGSIIEI